VDIRSFRVFSSECSLLFVCLSFKRIFARLLYDQANIRSLCVCRFARVCYAQAYCRSISACRSSSITLHSLHVMMRPCMWVHMSTAHEVTCDLVCSAYVDQPVLIWSAFVVFSAMSSLDELCSSIFRIPAQCPSERLFLPHALTSPLPKIGDIRTILDISAVSCSVVSCLCVWVCFSCAWLTMCGYSFVFGINVCVLSLTDISDPFAHRLAV
jgi:hypothetical protein